MFLVNLHNFNFEHTLFQAKANISTYPHLLLCKTHLILLVKTWLYFLGTNNIIKKLGKQEPLTCSVFFYPLYVPVILLAPFHTEN